MRAVIHPGVARGEVQAPPSKSMAHRLLICAGLAAGGESRVRGVARSEDMLATLDCLRALGAGVTWEGDDVRICGCDPRKAGGAALPCRECGSTLRFMVPLCLLSGRAMRLTGSETLMSRPLTVYEELCRQKGFLFEHGPDRLTVAGKLSAGIYDVPGNVSSQFVSGLLLALSLLGEESRIRLIPPVESRPYIGMTVQALRSFGRAVEWEREDTLFIPAGESFVPQDVTVEGDYSNAAFFGALNCLGGEVRVSGLRADSLQGDKVYTEYFPLLMQGHPGLDVSDCPDLAPVLFAVAAAHHGARFTGTRRLRFKESDRGAAMAEELDKFGVRLNIQENAIDIDQQTLHAPTTALSSHNDHRVAMALSVLCSRTGGEIEGAQAVKKSFPEYWERLRDLGLEVELIGMDQ